MTSPLRAVADRAATIDALPTSLRAVLGHYAGGRSFQLAAIRVQRRAEAAVEEIVDAAFADVEEALADEFDRDSVTFEYDTKLTMPVELTLGHVYRRATLAAPPGVDPVANERRTDPISRLRRRLGGGADPVPLARDVQRAERLAELVVEALLDGDMRDAINDEEYEDFAVDFPADDAERARVAEVAQATLQASVEERFERFPDAVREAYERAVAVSERHQDRDPHFRELMAEAEAGEDGAREALREEYKFADFDDPPETFTDAERDLPYLKTQYGRVGVIYDGMVEMFRAGDVDLDEAFERSIVLMIIGAQVWLDDVDDFPADMAEGQLTPVTAEYLLADDDAAAYEAVLAVTDRYLERATEAAAAGDSPLTGIAIEYIRHSGDPSVLPR